MEKPDTASPALVRDRDLEARTSIPRDTWKDWRYRRIGPPYIKAGRHVLYDPAEVDRWLSDRRVVPGGATWRRLALCALAIVAAMLTGAGGLPERWRAAVRSPFEDIGYLRDLAARAYPDASADQIEQLARDARDDWLLWRTLPAFGRIAAENEAGDDET